MTIELDPMFTTDVAPDLSGFCRERLSPLTRSDQRRWGEVYIRGLITVPGRKSIRRISDYVVGWRADQCLQQFVNQSTWQWEPVRRNLAEYVTGLVVPKAWVVSEAVFPKNGASSVGVAKQYAPSAGRILNCQLGLTVQLAGDSASCPVNWRLLLPRCWDTDEPRRERAHVPTAQRHRPYWSYLLDAVDEMTVGWDLAPAPVLVDASDQGDVELLLRGLEDRGLRYLVQVAPHLPARPARPRAPGGRVPSVGELALLAVRPAASTLNWQTRTEARAATTRFVASPVPGEVETPRLVGTAVHRHRHRPPRHLLVQWTVGRSRPRATWLTNLNVARLPQLIDLVKLSARAGDHLGRMHDDVGLRHFEGRSFRGWHHHVTMSSIAYAYRLGQELHDRPDELLLRPYA
ncbi:IS701 family transposase [Actinophytocola sp.]|uniref:IS701 family transposase n=1 Tax=Actinophytocola sp. TaxID=1872138 RepID=UPI002ED66E8A